MQLNRMTQLKITPYALNQQAGAHQQISTLVKDQPEKEALRQSTFLPVESDPNLPPNMRMWKRLEYLEEYIHYWRWGIITRIIAVPLLIAGVLTLPVFAPGALVMFAVAARLLDLSWWYHFIVYSFGKSRTIVLVD